jgi:hypothetical protein
MFYNNPQLIHLRSIVDISTKSTCIMIACILLVPFLIVFRRYKRAVEVGGLNHALPIADNTL